MALGQYRLALVAGSPGREVGGTTALRWASFGCCQLIALQYTDEKFRN